MILPVGGGQFSAAAPKSGFGLSPGRLAVGGLELPSKGGGPAIAMLPEVGSPPSARPTSVPTARSGAKRDLCAHRAPGRGRHLPAGRRLTRWRPGPTRAPAVSAACSSDRLATRLCRSARADA